MKQIDVILGKIYFWENIGAMALIKLIRQSTSISGYNDIYVAKFIKNIKRCESLMSHEHHIWLDCCRELTNIEKIKYL